MLQSKLVTVTNQIELDPVYIQFIFCHWSAQILRLMSLDFSLISLDCVVNGHRRLFIMSNLNKVIEHLRHYFSKR